MRITMTKKLAAIALIAIVLVGSSRTLGAVTDTKPLTVSATVSATAKLTVSSTTVSFPNADPDTTPSIAASEGALSIVAKSKTGASGSVTLTIVGDGTELVSGSDSILLSNVTWTAGGAGFVAGTMNKSTAQTVASWTGSGNRSGSQTYALANSWNYATGSYSTTATYTLTAP